MHREAIGASIGPSLATCGGLIRFGGMTDKKIYHQPSSVTAEEGDVLVKGPDEVDVALSPEAAEETSNRLLEGSMKARGQRHFKHYPHRPK